eukprot:5548537-Pleurochrysis_carterae.AAC.1
MHRSFRLYEYKNSLPAACLCSELEDNALSGTIPASLTDLTSLTNLCANDSTSTLLEVTENGQLHLKPEEALFVARSAFDFNFLTGPIPESFGLLDPEACSCRRTLSLAASRAIFKSPHTRAGRIFCKFPAVCRKPCCLRDQNSVPSLG